MSETVITAVQGTAPHINIHRQALAVPMFLAFTTIITRTNTTTITTTALVYLTYSSGDFSRLGWVLTGLAKKGPMVQGFFYRPDALLLFVFNVFKPQSRNLCYSSSSSSSSSSLLDTGRMQQTS